ncbi:helicase HerA-like domain-containing protein [Thermoanaerobaculum aquaticum]|uniref:helicase HerA-like domain-containing protein n=1 Tax=Thermoanaerobaculum aquaticum TaxID=1312852 RepID=UPI00190F1890|nr:helicase HerA-like domain-containing protein [Thermoanaerobaculum aquaticum]
MEGIFLGKGETAVFLPFSRANRHGLIAGATGTGKTITLQLLAEGFSRAGVPVVVTDVKGDLAGMAFPGADKAPFLKRAQELGLTSYGPQAFPVIFWDALGEQGHPLRATVSDVGPLLLSRLLELSEAQEGALNVAFRWADEQGLLLLVFKDLQALLQHLTTHRDAVAGMSVPSTSLGAIQRRLVVLQQQGVERFLGEPMLDVHDLMLTAPDGRGAVNILSCDRLFQYPRLYATVLLWLLAELYENLPEVGDVPKPKQVLFFDEAHVIFEDAPRVLLEKIEQVVRLVRSKGVGVYFVTQNPLDVPDSISAQLGHRVQHALRAFTPREQKAVKTAAETFRPNPRLDTAAVITQLGIGEALVSVLQEDGTPSPVERVKIAPPVSRVGAISPEERAKVRAASPLAGKYEASLDRESAYEVLTKPQETPVWGGWSWGGGPPRPSQPSRRGDTLAEALLKSAARSVGSSLGRQIVRGILGSLLRGR